MNFFKKFLWVLALIVIFYLLLLNISQTVDLKFFFGDFGVIKNVSLIVIMFVSILCGFLLGVFFMIGEVFVLKKRVKFQNDELVVLKEEVDSHRNIVVKDVLESKHTPKNVDSNEKKGL